jgi:hypothetical protein
MNPSDQITAYIDALGDWRGKTVARLRAVIRAASPDLVEQWKWSTPVWSRQGNVLAVGAFQDHVKLNFFQGASLDGPAGLFNAGLDAKATRAIDLHQGDSLDEAALRDLIRAAVALNRKPPKPKSRSSRWRRVCPGAGPAFSGSSRRSSCKVTRGSPRTTCTGSSDPAFILRITVIQAGWGSSPSCRPWPPERQIG